MISDATAFAAAASSIGSDDFDASRDSWVEENHRDLCAHLDRVRGYLQEHLERAAPGASTSNAAAAGASTCPPPGAEGGAEDGAEFAVTRVTEAFGLSPFERDVLLLCAGVELDARLAALCARLQGPLGEGEKIDESRAWASWGLALSALPGAHWSAIRPDGPLRSWRLLHGLNGVPRGAQVLAPASLTLSPLRVDERILHGLCGLDDLEESLRLLSEPLFEAPLSDSQRAMCARAAGVWRGAAELPLLLFHGADARTRRAVAWGVCDELNAPAHVVSLESWPVEERESALLWRLWEREAMLGGRVLLLEGEGGEDEAARLGVLARHARRSPLPVLLSTARRADLSAWQAGCGAVAFEVERPTPGEQSALWHLSLQAALPESAMNRFNGHLESCVDEMAMNFDVAPSVIAAASAEAAGQIVADEEIGVGEAGDHAVRKYLWGACRRQARPQLDELAQRLEGSSSWENLVLPRSQEGVLREIAAHVRCRGTVYGHWGFGAKGTRGLGMGALFAGPSGTGKTLAAEVLGNALDLDVYRIDLSTTVSKYIGETEKNLARIFDAAEQGGAILLFDEADALFGKRSEVKDSHDRHANVEVGFLLQRMESYRGLAVLTTNLKSSLDTAFLRRLRFVVEFPFPDAAQRAEIWRRAFPPQAPRENLDPKKLARLAVAGGNIRNMALNAAFLAADAGEPIRMEHILRSAQSEYAKLEKTLTDAEVRGWV
jgi:hypothetical protein